MPSSGSTSRITSRYDICGCTVFSDVPAILLRLGDRRGTPGIAPAAARLRSSARAPSAASATIGTSARTRCISAGSISMRASFGPAACRPSARSAHRAGCRMPISRSVIGHSFSAAGTVRPRAMTIIDDAAATAERDHRRADLLGQSQDFRAGVQRAAADPDHRRLRRIDQFRQRGDAFRVRHRVGQRRQRVHRRHLGDRRRIVPTASRSRPGRGGPTAFPETRARP